RNLFRTTRINHHRPGQGSRAYPFGGGVPMSRSLLCCAVALYTATSAARADFVFLTRTVGHGLVVSAEGMEVVDNATIQEPPLERHLAFAVPFAAATMDFRIDGLAGDILA